MANALSPYGLRPINLIGGQPYAGAIREIKLSTNNSAAIYNGDIVQLTSAGNPQAISATPVAIKIPATSADATAGIVGVCVGVRYQNPSAAGGQFFYGQYLPANAITNGYSNVWIRVVDDPDALFIVQAKTAVGSLTNGVYGAIGKNAPLSFATSGSTATGNSGIALDTGTNWGTLASTSTLAMRIVDINSATAADTYPDLIVKFNVGVHSYQNSLGV
jgi:hypothetical protein